MGKIESETFSEEDVMGLPDCSDDGLYRGAYFGELAVEPFVSERGGAFGDGGTGRGGC